MTHGRKKLLSIGIATLGLVSCSYAQTISITENETEQYKITDCGNTTQHISFSISTDKTVDLSGLVIGIAGDDEIIKHMQVTEKGANTLLPNIYHGWTPLRDGTASVSSLSSEQSLSTEQLFQLNIENKILKGGTARTFELSPVVGCDTTAVYSINILGVVDNGIIRLASEGEDTAITFQQEMTITPVKGNDLSINEITFDDELRIGTVEMCFETKQPRESFEAGISSVLKIINKSRGSRLEVPAIRENNSTESCIKNELTYEQLGIDKDNQENEFHFFINENRSYNLREDDMRNNHKVVAYKASVDYSFKKPTVERKEVTTFPNAKIAFELCNISFNTPLNNPGGDIKATIKNKTNNVDFQTTARYNDVLKKDDCIYFWAHRKDLGIRNQGIYLINIIIEDALFLSQFNEIPIFRPKLIVEQGEERMIENHTELEFGRVLISEENVTATICNNGGVAVSNKDISLRFNKNIEITSGEKLLENHEHTEKLSLKPRTCVDVVVPLVELPEEFFVNNPNKELKIWIFSSYNDIQEYDYENNSFVIDTKIESKKLNPYDEREFCRYSNCKAYIERIETLKSTVIQQEKQKIIRTIQYLISNLANDDKKDILLFLLDRLQE